MPTTIEELSSQDYGRTHATNYATNGYPTRTQTATQPSGDGVISMGHGGGVSARGLELLPYGTGSSGNTFSLKVLGWRPTKLGIGTALWVPSLLTTCQVTLGTQTGVANTDLGTTTLFGTTITCSYGPTWITSGAAPVVPDWFQLSPGSNDTASVFVRSLGFRFLEVIYTTGGVATDCNALWCRY